MEDVYGLTSDLKVYYCSKGKDSIIGINKDKLDVADSTKEVFAAGSNMAKLITGEDNKNVILEDLKGIKTLTIDNTSGITNLKDFYALISLQELTLDGLTLDSLDGIENAIQLNYIFFKSSVVSDYSSLSKVGNLKYLYSTGTTNSEIEKMCNGIKNAEFSNLQYLGIYNSPSLTDISGLANLSTTTKQAVKYLYLYKNKISSISALSEYINVVRLEVNSNDNLITLSGCENMNKLEILYAEYCNLGANEVYDLALENNGKNDRTDALSCLSGKTLVELRISGNSNLKWISYLKDSINLKFFHASLCNNIVLEDFGYLRDIISKIQVTHKTFPDKYLTLFNTDTTINYKNLNLNDSSDEIQALLNNTTVKELSLYENNDLSNDRIVEILSTCTSIRCLQLYGLSNLTSLEFVENMPDLHELDLRGTSVTNLEILEELTINGKLNLRTLAIDNENIQLNNIQTVISNLSSEKSSEGFLSSITFGCIFENETLLNQLSNCTEITSFICSISGANIVSGILDLSNCTFLKKIQLGYETFSVIIPSNCTHYTQNAMTNIVPDLTYATSLENLYLSISGITQENLDTMFATANNLNNLKDIYISARNISNGNMFSSLEIFNNFSENNVVSSFTLGKYNGDFKTMNSLKGIENFKNLKTLSLTETSISSLKYLENLNDLNSISITNSNIKDITAIRNLSNLSKLDLTNNCLYDTSTDSEGNTYNNLEILANLNKNGSLRNLYLTGNSGITDWTPLSSITNWTAYSGW